MQRPSLLLCCLLPFAATAQQWCAPGAEWTYGFGNQQASGITRAWYSGDSLQGGYTAQRIDQTIHAYQPVFPFGQPFTQELDPLFTRTENEVVYIWDGVSSTYDTLMWFGAVPGEHWNMHHQDGFARFDVLDTGTTVVDGIPLRYLVVEEPIVMGWVDTLRERIGFDYFYVEPLETFLIDWTTAMLHCYRDAEINEHHGSMWSGDCDFSVAVPEQQAAMSLLFPNPGSDHFILQLPGGMHTIEVFDATGRRVLSVRTTDANVRIDTEVLPAGLYQVRAMNAGGTVAHLLWLKQ